MALSPFLTPLEKRTAVLLTVIGILGSICGILFGMGIVVPVYLFTHNSSLVAGFMLLSVIGALFLHHGYVTFVVISMSIIVGFLPRTIYGIRLRKARQEHTRAKDDS